MELGQGDIFECSSPNRRLSEKEAPSAYVAPADQR